MPTDPIPAPVIQHLANEPNLRAVVSDCQSGRLIRHRGRTGLNVTAVKDAFALPAHTLNQPRGAASVWVMALEDIAVHAQHPHHREHLTQGHVIPILADAPGTQFDQHRAAFAFAVETNWHPQFYARWGRGAYYDTYKGQRNPAICCSHFEFHKGVWYQLIVTWDHPRGWHRIYANGIPIGEADRLADPQLQQPETASDRAYVGNPLLVIGAVDFFDQFLDPVAAEAIFRRACPEPDPEVQQHLRAVYIGQPTPFEGRPPGGWQERLELSLTDPADLNALRLQGNTDAVRITPDGLRITTPEAYFQHGPMPGLEGNQKHVYVWTRPVFEGDLYLEYQFMPLRPGGLSLLMTQCSGMQREDFFAEHPLSDTDLMRYLFGGSIRNYHWEYWRDMNDTRNTVASHVLVKNPFYRPLGYACRPQRLAENHWHHLAYLQEDSRIRCVINGDVVLDVTDSGFENNGAVYNFGRIAIRGMINTDLLCRNLRVLNRPQFEVLTDPGSGGFNPEAFH